MSWEDVEDEFTPAIKAAFPTRSESHETYVTALRMVGNRHSKGALVALVNWLLIKRDTLKLFGVTHQHFVTDTIGYTTTLFRAKSREEALEAYNKMAHSKKYSEYPYCWRPVDLDDVREPEVIDV
jgi:hypothetical protein